MGSGQASYWATLVAGLLMAVAAVAAPFLARRTSRDTSTVERARLEEEIRQNLLKGLHEMIADLQSDVREQRATVEKHEATIQTLRLENLDCLGDRAQLHNQLTDQSRAIQKLTGDNAQLATRVAELEKGK